MRLKIFPNIKAFTLIEVLIALLIIAIALAAAIRASNNSIHSTIHVRNTMIAHWVGLNILSEIQTGIITLPASGNDLRGQTKMLSREWKWDVKTESSSILNNVIQITVTVSVRNKKITSVVGYV